jgi:hypothetical protein
VAHLSILESADFPGFFLLTQQSFSTRIEVLSGPSWVIIIRANHDVCDWPVGTILNGDGKHQLMTLGKYDDGDRITDCHLRIYSDEKNQQCACEEQCGRMFPSE